MVGTTDLGAELSATDLGANLGAIDHGAELGSVDLGADLAAIYPASSSLFRACLHCSSSLLGFSLPLNSSNHLIRRI